MRATIIRIGATGAGVLLAVGLMTVPAAGATGSEKRVKSERSSTTASTTDCFDTSGKTQGRSHSDPDGMSNGGADKPGCTGGFDADRDGNNGCGNDADREDDNNGRCLKGGRDGSDDPTTDTTSTTTSTTSTTSPVTVGAAGENLQRGEAASSTPTTDSATVSAAGSSSPAGIEAATTTTSPQTEVLGQTLSRPSALARTGVGVGGLGLLGGLLCGGGRLALLARRFLRID